MPSQLTFAATSAIRNSLIGRNLKPYIKPGAFVYSVSNLPNQYEPSQYSVIDSPDQLIDLAPFADGLYLNNEFGPEGGFNKDISGLISVSQNPTNRGPYGPFPPYTDALKLFSTTFQKKGQIKNEYSPRDGFIRYYDIGDIVKVQKNATYWDPPSFRPSSYSPFSVLLQEIPTGSNGNVLQDSELAQLGVEFLKKAYQQRIDQNVRTETLGRVNILNGLQDPINLSLIVAGKRPLIFRDYKITSGGGNILSQGQDIVQRIAGFTFPFSPIPGDYFTVDNEQRTINSTQSLARSSEGGRRGGVFGLFGSRPTSPSQLFLDYTGEGQRAQLTNNLDYNRYRPRYNTGGRGVISVLGEAIFGSQVQDLGQGLYYVGSPDREPIYLNSPPGLVPINEFGEEILAPVYGSQVLGKEYEGQELSERLNFGFVGTTYQSQGDISGGLSWTNTKDSPNAGKRVRPNGSAGSQDPDFSAISDQFGSSESINYRFKAGSILDDTQRLVDSMPLDGRRYSHVGNAINQISKIFDDGYKQITKGSRVIGFTPNQLNTPLEYCRVFTKDTPYISYTDLQKSDGNIRKASYSILDKTYQLNIAPEKGGDSILRGEGGVKKYMFSIENLAWRTSSRPGLRYQDLPKCEQGPNGGRIMWFPPYDLDFSEDTRPSFNETTFLGRPEPIYTYKNTSRSGTLKWKILVDHPSVLNLVAQKVLANEGSRGVADQVINSFFAGCKKYDLYELAEKFNNVPLSDLQAYQELVNNPNVTPEQYSDALSNIKPDPETVSIQTTTPPTTPSFDEYVNFGFYFDNDIPKQSQQDFQPLYNTYVSQNNKELYRTNTKPTTEVQPVQEFFTQVVEGNYNKIKEFSKKLYDLLSQDETAIVKITLFSAASSPGSIPYNLSLSQKRNESALKFFQNYLIDGNKTLSDFIGSRIVINAIAQGETTVVNPKSGVGDNVCLNSVDCSQVLNGSAKIYSVAAMACRVSNIQSISVTTTPINPEPANTGSNIVLTQDGRPNQTRPSNNNNNNQPQVQKDLYKGASKKLLRLLLNECDYFEVLKETDFFAYNSIKNKLKYFSPSFHSMTPEGLNSRLTFLQQCARPGDTIPTIGPDGRPIYNDALNTSFGAPPVLVLRVGDFYNTKIIPTSFNITYEKLYDMNPEGIGFQPMIANVSMGFNFIGGSGLAKPIETLQNALSFNYYANTEVYDERAESTDTSFNALDQTIIEKLQNRLPTVGISNFDPQLQNLGGDTIGILVQTGSNLSGITGNLDYTKFVDQFLTLTQNYFTATIMFLDNVLKKYGYGMLTLLNTKYNGNLGYHQGVLIVNPVYIYGKPLLYQLNVDKVFEILSVYILNETIEIFTVVSPDGTMYSAGLMSNQSVTQTQKDIFKGNYERFIQTYRTNFINDLTDLVSQLVQIEQNYVYEIDKTTFLGKNLSDGKINSKGAPVVYNFVGDPTPQNRLVNDLQSISADLNYFLISLYDGRLYNDMYFQSDLEKPLNDPFSSFVYYTPNELGASNALKTSPQQVEYLLLAKIYTNQTTLQQFLRDLSEGLDPFVRDIVYRYYGTLLKNTYDRLTKNGINLLDTYKQTLGKNFVNFTPTFQSNTGPQIQRTIDFQENFFPSDVVKTQLTNLYSPNNIDINPSTFNFKKKFN